VSVIKSLLPYSFFQLASASSGLQWRCLRMGLASIWITVLFKNESSVWIA
jgi:hypothetical protein